MPVTDSRFLFKKLSRRELFQSCACLLSSTIVKSDEPGGQGQERDRVGKRENVPSGYIDAHVHVWTSDTKRYPLAPSYRPEQMRPSNFPPEELLSHARACGVGRIVLIQMSYYGYDNSYMLETMRRFPRVFSGVAVIDGTVRPQETMRRLSKQGVRGFRISPRGIPPDRWLETPGMVEMWRCGAEENLAMCCLIGPDAVPVVGAMCEKFPQTPVIIDHIASIRADSKLREEQVKQLCKLARYKRTMVKISAFYALAKKELHYLDLAPVIRCLFEAYGPERLMWATDCPFQVQDGHTYLDSVSLIRDRLDFLSDSDRQWLLRRAAERVFFP